jgi:transcription antitermination protein NusB
MGKRNTGRKLAMQLLYQADIRKETINSILDDFTHNTNYLEPTKEWSCYLAGQTFAHKKELDQIIQKYAIDWSLNRMNVLDKSLLRLAIFEIQYTDTPPKVVVDEIVGIAKRYSAEESPKFINGLLGEFLKKEIL